jgi:hypothetical protein
VPPRAPPRLFAGLGEAFLESSAINIARRAQLGGVRHEAVEPRVPDGRLSRVLLRTQTLLQEIEIVHAAPFVRTRAV